MFAFVFCLADVEACDCSPEGVAGDAEEGSDDTGEDLCFRCWGAENIVYVFNGCEAEGCGYS